MSGLVTYEKNPDYKTKRQQKQQKEKEQNQQSFGYGGGYVAPDANLDADTFTYNTGSSSGSKREALKNLGTGVYNKLKDVDKDNLPMRIQLADESVLKKRVKASKTGGLHPSITDKDPNNFDYDLDELIAEEQEKDALDLKESVARANQGFSDV
ncbi:unnamed protein product [Ambrosiozyma monospora]|uniref:Unnamed protein product n=1 Tax=Ambrosiozyma monospora TaxID=43982 RepID=A0A9W6YY27_AMBMO|nr:unnamed protein product [Ambrosiozyma monospora]